MGSHHVFFFSCLCLCVGRRGDLHEIDGCLGFETKDCVVSNLNVVETSSILRTSKFRQLAELRSRDNLKSGHSLIDASPKRNPSHQPCWLGAPDQQDAMYPSSPSTACSLHSVRMKISLSKSPNLNPRISNAPAVNPIFFPNQTVFMSDH